VSCGRVAQGEIATTRAAFGVWRAQHQLPVGTPVALETGTVAFLVARQLATLAAKTDNRMPREQANGMPNGFRPAQAEENAGRTNFFGAFYLSQYAVAC